MKAALALIAFSGFILSISAVCNSNDCGIVVGQQNCSVLNAYVDCLHKEADGCKATPGDIAKKMAIESLIAGENIAKGVEGCGACAVTVSITTLVLSLVAFFVKL